MILTTNSQNPPGENFSAVALSNTQLDREQRRKMAWIIMKYINRLSLEQNCHAPLRRCKGTCRQDLMHQVWHGKMRGVVCLQDQKPQGKKSSSSPISLCQTPGWSARKFVFPTYLIFLSHASRRKLCGASLYLRLIRKQYFFSVKQPRFLKMFSLHIKRSCGFLIILGVGGGGEGVHFLVAVF